MKMSDKPKNVTVEWVLVTIEIARALLTTNTTNYRKISPQRWKRYAKEMLADTWEINGVTIIIDNKGKLKDGQHRLLAVINSGVPIWFLIVRGIKAKGLGIDRGKARSIGEWLAHEGYPNASCLAATARLIALHRHGLWARGGIKASEVVDNEILKVVEENYPKLEEALSYGKPLKGIAPVPLCSCIAYESSNLFDTVKENEHLVWFLSSLKTGEMLYKHQHVHMLRRKFLHSMAQTASLSSLAKRLFMTLAWNRTILMQEQKSLQLTPSNTPESIEEAPNE